MNELEERPTCPSCGVPYSDHLGLIGTCAELQRVLPVLKAAVKLPELFDRSGEIWIVDRGCEILVAVDAYNAAKEEGD